MILQGIVAVDRNWAIGKNGQLLLHLPEDLKFFRKQTLNSTVIMGRKTLASFPNAKALPKRENWLLSRTASDIENVRIFNSVDEVLLELNNKFHGKDEVAWVIGGTSVYEQFLPYCQKIYVTKVDYEADDADAFFPNLDLIENWQLTGKLEPVTCENGIKLQVNIYENLHCKRY